VASKHDEGAEDSLHASRFKLHGACGPVFEDKRRQFNKLVRLTLESRGHRRVLQASERIGYV